MIPTSVESGQPPSANRLPTRKAIALLLVLYVFVGVIYSFATPPFEASDEISHYPVVRHIIESRSLPRQDQEVDKRIAQEGSQPPLYYLLSAGLTGWIDTYDYEENAVINPFAKIGIPGTPNNVNMVAHPPAQSSLLQGGTLLAVMLLRWFSLVLGAFTIYLVFMLALTVYPHRSTLALLAAALAAFNPMLLFINASVNNDNLLILLTTLGLLLLVRDLQSSERGPRWRSTLLLGLVLGLAVLTKVSGNVLLPVAALAVSLSAYKVKDWRSWLIRGVVLVAMTVLIGGWWYLRNQMLYGEMLGIGRMADIAGSRPAGFALLDLVGEWTGFWYSYWGVFGGFNLLAPSWFFTIVGGLLLVAGLGLLLGLGRRFAHRDWRDWQIHLVLILFLLGTFLGILRWTLMTPASQGRLMFGGIGAISMYLAIGLLIWIPQRRHQIAIIFMSSAMAVIAIIIAFGTIVPAYRPPPPIPSLPANARPLDIRYGDHLRLVGYALGERVIDVGDPLDITLYWKVNESVSENLNLALNGYGFGFENVAKLDTWPGGGLLPTSHWQTGALYEDHYLIDTLPFADTPSVLKLDVAVWENTLDNYLDIYDTDQSIPIVLLDAGALVRPEQAVPDVDFTPKASLQHGIRLLDDAVVTQNGDLNVALTWTTSAPIPGDYTTFVHLFDAQGNRVAQSDGIPHSGYWPTSFWRPGEAVSSSHIVSLPSDLPPGEYTIHLGMYDPMTVERLMAYHPSGEEWRDWAIILSPPIILP